MRKKAFVRCAVVFLGSFILFLIPTYFSNTVLSAYDVTSVRPSAALNPVLGIGFGWPAILGCALANFVSDLLSGWGITVALDGFLPQLLYGALPYYVWRAVVGSESRRTRLDGPRRTLAFALLMLANAALIGLAVGAIQYHVSRSSFGSTALFAFLNDFDMCMIFGLPLMALIDFLYSKYLHSGRRRLSFNEKIILVSSGVQFAAFLLVAVFFALRYHDWDIPRRWQQIFLISGYAVNGILLLSVAVMTYFSRQRTKHAGLRIIEKPHGTVFVDEKRHLEFVSFPTKALEYRVKSNGLGYTYANTRKAVRPAYENAWYTMLSNQKGCPMKCTFCDCPGYGFFGNVSLEDLRYQMDVILDNNLCTHTRWFEVDFMRMGEPTLNPAILPFLENHLQDMIRQRVDAEVIYPALSTMLPRNNRKITEFLQEFCRIKNEVYDGNAALQLSINTTDEALRRKMFRNMSMSLEEIARVAAALPAPKGRKYALNFAVTKDSVIDAQVIDRLFDKSKFFVKLTPIHQTFNAQDNGFEVTTEYDDFSVFESFEKPLLDLGWEVMTFLDSAEEDQDGLTCGNLLLPDIEEKFVPKPSEKKKVGIIVAIEIDAIFTLYPDLKEIKAPEGYRLYLVEKEHISLYILQAGMGEIAASAGVQYLISQCKASIIFNFGVTGGLTEQMKKQKICLVDRVVHYKYDCSEFMDLVVGQVDGHESIYLKPNELLVKNAQAITDDLMLATCCSGDKFVGSAEEKTYLHETFGGDICDMESAGIVLACEMNRVPCLLLKAVSDGLADGAEGFYNELQSASLSCLKVADQIMEALAAKEY